MSRIARTRDPHRNAAIACGGLIAVSLLLAIAGRYQPAATTLAPDAVTASISLIFSDTPDGTVVATEAGTGVEIQRLTPGDGGFVRVAMRSLAGERKRRSLSSEQPFVLARTSDGALRLRDPATGRSLLLNAFGPSNEAVFAELLDHRRTTP